MRSTYRVADIESLLAGDQLHRLDTWEPGQVLGDTEEIVSANAALEELPHHHEMMLARLPRGRTDIQRL